MTENIDKTKKKKTLSLKLGSTPMLAPKKSIEAGKTVIVEKKRYKRGTGSDSQSIKKNIKETTAIDKQVSINNEKNVNQNKSGVVLKPLSKDEQKRILKADTKKDKKDAIEKIRSSKSINDKVQLNDTSVSNTDINLDNVDHRDIKKDILPKRFPSKN